MRLYLGVDGGQSSTTALIGDETGRVLGGGNGGPCNHVRSAEEGRRKFIRVMEECIGAACGGAGVDPSAVRFHAACLGFSGGPEDKLPILEEMLRTEKLVVTTDAPIALAGATGGEPGIITIAGTGSISFGRNAEGKTARTGGWGYLFGDEGAGFDLTRQALRAILRQDECWGPPTRLREMLLDATGAGSAHDLLHRFYTMDFPRPRIAALSKLVDKAAEEGDQVALGLVHNAAQELATYTAAVRRQLFADGEPARVAYIGGVFRSRILLERYRTIVELEEGNRVAAPVFGPAAGALLEAYRAAGLKPELTNLPEFKT